MTGLILIMGLMEADNVLGRVVYFNELAGRGNISWSEWDSLLTMGASGGDTGAVVFALDKLVSKGKLSASARDSVMQEYSLLKSKTGDPASRVVFSDSVLAMTAQRLGYDPDEFMKGVYDEFKLLGGTDMEWLSMGLGLPYSESSSGGSYYGAKEDPCVGITGFWGSPLFSNENLSDVECLDVMGCTGSLPGETPQDYFKASFILTSCCLTLPAIPFAASATDSTDSWFPYYTLSVLGWGFLSGLVGLVTNEIRIKDSGRDTSVVCTYDVPPTESWSGWVPEQPITDPATGRLRGFERVKITVPGSSGKTFTIKPIPRKQMLKNWLWYSGGLLLGTGFMWLTLYTLM